MSDHDQKGPSTDPTARTMTFEQLKKYLMAVKDKYVVDNTTAKPMKVLLENLKPLESMRAGEVTSNLKHLKALSIPLMLLPTSHFSLVPKPISEWLYDVGGKFGALQAIKGAGTGLVFLVNVSGIGQLAIFGALGSTVAFSPLVVSAAALAGLGFLVAEPILLMSAIAFKYLPVEAQDWIRINYTMYFRQPIYSTLSWLGSWAAWVAGKTPYIGPGIESLLNKAGEYAPMLFGFILPDVIPTGAGSAEAESRMIDGN